MLHQEFGTVFIGFTKALKCKHCNNLTPMQIRQAYAKQSVFLVPIGTSHSSVYEVCPVCEKKERLIVSKLFSSQEKRDNLLELLDGGKEYTKEWVSRLSYKEREQVFKRLNSFKAFDLVKYLAS